MTDRLRLEYDHMMASTLGDRGLDPALFEATQPRVRDVHAHIENERAAGGYAFLDLPVQTESLQGVLDFAANAQGAYDDVVVLGIGGSALGTIALREALLGPFWNDGSPDRRAGRPRLHVLDNVDPVTVAALLDQVDLRRTLFNVVSKSGTTAETMAQFLIVHERLGAALPGDDLRRNLVFTTDPERGVLRRLASEQGITTFPVPVGVGGRFSVLSDVGLLPAALVGIDVHALLAGAADMVERCSSATLGENPAATFAALQYLADTEAHAPIHVVMAYCDRLYPIADWFRQLWAESLGKRQDRDGREVFRGPTPVKALGATDQHSQVQLYMEGPFDKTVTFLALRDLADPLPIPPTDIKELSYLGGRSLGQLLDAERLATTQALTKHRRMNMTIELPALTAHHLGELLMLFQIATIYAGGLYHVDPLDQPGVELGKELTYALMGRPGYRPFQPRVPDPRWVLD